jgi:hypothetical protein
MTDLEVPDEYLGTSQRVNEVVDDLYLLSSTTN